jgi:hypothetical protein
MQKCIQVLLTADVGNALGTITPTRAAHATRNKNGHVIVITTAINNGHCFHRIVICEHQPLAKLCFSLAKLCFGKAKHTEKMCPVGKSML